MRTESTPSASTPDAESSTAESVSPDTEETAVSWDGPSYARSRSAAVGCLLAVLAAFVAVIAAGVAAAVFSGSLSVELLLVGGVLLLVGGPVSVLYIAIAYAESTDSEKQSVRRAVWPLSDEQSWLRPGWVGGGGALGAVGVWWWLSGTGLRVGTLAPLVAGLAPLVAVAGRSSYRLDSNRGTLETEYGEYSHERSLAWLVGVRRLRVGSVSLFVCSNRGKRWYEGVHLLAVPQPVDDQVDDILRRAAGSDPPRRVKRDERILFGVIGASMIGVGPFLYFLSSEPALLFILAGPSTLIGLGVVLHALRG